jgi:hypothetical protein
MKSDFSGIKKLQRDMEKASKELEKIDFSKLFTKSFMLKYTNLLSFDEFLTASSFEIESKEDFEAIPDIEFDFYVNSCTKFATWQDMLDTATQEHITRTFKF